MTAAVEFLGQGAWPLGTHCAGLGARGVLFPASPAVAPGLADAAKGATRLAALSRGAIPWRRIADWTHRLPKTPTDTWLDLVDGYVRGPGHRWLRHHPLDFARAWLGQAPDGPLGVGHYIRHVALDAITVNGLPLLPEQVHSWLLSCGIPAHVLYGWTHLNIFDLSVGAVSLGTGGYQLFLAVTGRLPWGGLNRQAHPHRRRAGRRLLGPAAPLVGSDRPAVPRDAAEVRRRGSTPPVRAAAGVGAHPPSRPGCHARPRRRHRLGFRPAGLWTRLRLAAHDRRAGPVPPEGRTPMNDRQKKAAQLAAAIDGLFHAAEQTHPQHEVTYLDVVRIADYVREQFDLDPPPEIAAALDVACGLCHSSKVDALRLLRKGLGALIGLGGGTALLWGILYILANGVILTTTTGMLWWKASATAIVVGGPVGLGVGIAALALGVYVFALQVSLKKRAITALDVMRAGINKWAAA